MRHSRNLSPIQTIKHFVPRTLAAVATSAVLNHKLAEGVDAPATSAVTDCIQSAVIKAIWVELWIIHSGAAGTTTTFTITLERADVLQSLMTLSNALNLSSYANKNNVIYTTQGIIGSDNVANPIPILRQWFKIPKGKQRLGLGKNWILNVANSGGESINVCGMVIYKEYR